MDGGSVGARTESEGSGDWLQENEWKSGMAQARTRTIRGRARRMGIVSVETTPGAPNRRISSISSVQTRNFLSFLG